jgi:K+-transporting ATPase ATPase C chain
MKCFRVLLVLTLLTGVLYPLFVTGVAQLAFHRQANGSLVKRSGRVVGSKLLAQKFESNRYFWPRPSAADYATVPSGASNKGPTNADLRAAVAERTARIRAVNNLTVGTPIPPDLLYDSGSGLDPHISPEAARLQITRIAAARGLTVEHVTALVNQSIELPSFGFLGEPRVNVLLLNLAVDEQDFPR